MSRRSPLISPPATPPPRLAQHWDEEDDETDAPTRRKRWYHYMPLLLAVILMLLPHPSLLIVLVNYHLRVLNSPLQFLTHLTVTYTLSFLAFSSLILILARDPGPVSLEKETETGAISDEEDGMSFMQALLAPDGREEQGHGRWCRKCNAPKPERTHHCSTCGRCVLKMDHHCLWLGDRCIGHRTYSAFLHLLTCVTLLSIYIAVLCIEAVYFAFTNPLSIDENTPLHDIYLAFYGIVMALVFGSFWIYHLYLTTTNQTTLEHLSPFLLLRHLPPLPPPTSGVKALSNPPQEFELSYPQRRLVRDAHHYVRLYDVGWRKNWGQVMGWDRPWGWMYRLLVGGGGKGDGKSFPRNPRADEMLVRLAAELVSADKD